MPREPRACPPAGVQIRGRADPGACLRGTGPSGGRAGRGRALRGERAVRRLALRGERAGPADAPSAAACPVRRAPPASVPGRRRVGTSRQVPIGPAAPPLSAERPSGRRALGRTFQRSRARKSESEVWPNPRMIHGSLSGGVESRPVGGRRATPCDNRAAVRLCVTTGQPGTDPGRRATELRAPGSRYRASSNGYDRTMSAAG